MTPRKIALSALCLCQLEARQPDLAATCRSIQKGIDEVLSNRTRTECLVIQGQTKGTSTIALVATTSVFDSESRKRAWITAATLSAGHYLNLAGHSGVDWIVLSDDNLMKSSRGYFVRANLVAGMQLQVKNSALQVEELYTRIGAALRGMSVPVSMVGRQLKSSSPNSRQETRAPERASSASILGTFSTLESNGEDLVGIEVYTMLGRSGLWAVVLSYLDGASDPSLVRIQESDGAVEFPVPAYGEDVVFRGRLTSEGLGGRLVGKAFSKELVIPRRTAYWMQR